MSGKTLSALNTLVFELTAERDALRAQVEAALALHQPFECSNVRCKGGGLHCSTCEEGLAAQNGINVHWPCPTVRALSSSEPVTADPEDEAEEAKAAANYWAMIQSGRRPAGEVTPPAEQRDDDCEMPTMTTDHGTYLDWSVPRFCNRPMGHSGSHVYTRPARPTTEGGQP